jgi:nitroreductase
MILGPTMNACAIATQARPVHAPAHDAPLLQVLTYASLAPSSHNTQPWRVRLVGHDTADLLLDESRLLTEVDPGERQAVLSHGAFLEAARQAAASLGHHCHVDLLPSGAPDSPLARIRLEPSDVSPKGDALTALRLRQTNKRTFEDKSIAPTDLRRLLDQVDEPGVAVRAVVEPRKRRVLAEVCRDAMQIEVQSPARNRELSRWFRLGSAERGQAEDGFGLGQSGVTGFKRWVAENFVLSRDGMDAPDSGFSKTAVEMTYDQAASAQAFVVLATRANDRRTQLRAGAAYLRLHLAATRLGIQVHPLSQATQEYADMTALRHRLHVMAASPGETVQMLLRLGYADPVEYTPRRRVASLMVNG